MAQEQSDPFIAMLQPLGNVGNHENMPMPSISSMSYFIKPRMPENRGLKQETCIL